MKRTILVVDDDKSNLLIAQKLLSDEYRVAVVNSGEKHLNISGRMSLLLFFLIFLCRV